MELHSLDTFQAVWDSYHDAVCNDGSPGAFYFQNATDPAKAHLWMVYLEGGGWCYDDETCYTRMSQSPSLTSSQNHDGSARWPMQMKMSGIFDSDPERNPWAGANLVQIGYCSSDMWVGNVVANDTPLTNLENALGNNGWNFKGQRIIQATMAVLAAEYGMGEVPNTRLLFGGCSEGASGAMFNLDYLGSMVPLGVQVRGFLDSPLWVEMQPLPPDVLPLENQTMAVFDLVNATARLGQNCPVSYPEDLWKCMWTQFRAPFVRTPFLMSASQFDQFQLPYNEGSPPPYDAGQMMYAAQYQLAVRGILELLPNMQQPGTAIFSSSCYKHCTSTTPLFWGVRVGGLNLKDYLAMWYFGADNVSGEARAQPNPALPIEIPDQWVEACVGFGCGQCHNKSYGPAAILPPRHPAPAPTVVAKKEFTDEQKKAFVQHFILLALLLGAVALAAVRVRSSRRGVGPGVQLRPMRSSEQTPLMNTVPATVKGASRTATPVAPIVVRTEDPPLAPGSSPPVPAASRLTPGASPQARPESRQAPARPESRLASAATRAPAAAISGAPSWAKRS